MSETNEIQMSFPFRVLEEETLNPLLGHQMSETENFVATALLEATSEKPFKISQVKEAIAKAFDSKVDDRRVKDIVRTLRRDHGFPILSRREKPAGYYWATSEDEFKEFMRHWKAQYIDEAVTLRQMARINFPRLAGQKNLFLDGVKTA